MASTQAHQHTEHSEQYHIRPAYSGVSHSAKNTQLNVIRVLFCFTQTNNNDSSYRSIWGTHKDSQVYTQRQGVICKDCGSTFPTFNNQDFVPPYEEARVGGRQLEGLIPPGWGQGDTQKSYPLPTTTTHPPVARPPPLPSNTNLNAKVAKQTQARAPQVQCLLI